MRLLQSAQFTVTQTRLCLLNYRNVPFEATVWRTRWLGSGAIYSKNACSFHNSSSLSSTGSNHDIKVPSHVCTIKPRFWRATTTTTAAAAGAADVATHLHHLHHAHTFPSDHYRIATIRFAGSQSSSGGCAHQRRVLTDIWSSGDGHVVVLLMVPFLPMLMVIYFQSK